MNKILYREISSNDNLWRVVQALIDKQGEIVDKLNEQDKFIKGLQGVAENQEIIK